MCNKSFNTNDDLIEHMNREHHDQHFRTLDRYTCDPCDFYYTTRKEFKEHMHYEHVEVPEDESFELNILEKWVSTDIVDWSSLPEAVVARREEAIRNKEAKEVNQGVASQPLGTIPAPTPTSPTTTNTHSPPPTPQVRNTASPGLAQWSGSILGTYLESMDANIKKQSKMIWSLHAIALADWQYRAIQTCKPSCIEKN